MFDNLSLLAAGVLCMLCSDMAPNLAGNNGVPTLRTYDNFAFWPKMKQLLRVVVRVWWTVYPNSYSLPLPDCDTFAFLTAVHNLLLLAEMLRHKPPHLRAPSPELPALL